MSEPRTTARADWQCDGVRIRLANDEISASVVLEWQQAITLAAGLLDAALKTHDVQSCDAEGEQGGK